MYSISNHACACERAAQETRVVVAVDERTRDGGIYAWRIGLKGRYTKKKKF